MATAELDDPESTPRIPATPSDAFDQAAAGSVLFGQPIEAWSNARRIAANAMGLTWLTADGAADQIRTNGVYAGALRDVIIFAWLSSIKNASQLAPVEVKSGVWSVQRATRAPAEAFDAATEWAGHHQLVDVASPAFVEAYKLFMAVMLGVDLSEFNAEPPADAKPPSPPADPNA